MVSTPPVVVRTQLFPVSLLLITIILLLNILLSTQNQAEIIQQIGIPINGMVEEGGWHYYYVDPSLFSSAVATFALTPLSGEVYMYVSTYGQPTLQCEKCLLSYPSLLVTANGTWPSNGNIFTIGVYGNTPARFTFNLWGSTSPAHVTLVDGQPQHSQVERNGYSYFKVKVTGQLPTKLYISIGTQEGDSDLYVSGTSQFPTSTDYDYASRSYGPDSVTIPVEENSPREYWIGVYGYFVDNKFTLVSCQANTSTVISESLSIAFREDSPTSDLHYFVYNNLILQNLKFEVIVRTTKMVDFYIKYGTKPTENSYDYYMLANREKVKQIPMSDSKVGTYYIGIKIGLVTLTVKSMPEYVLLQEDVAVNGTVAANQLNYYQHNKKDMLKSSLTLTVFFGSVKLFLSFESERPNQYVHTRAANGTVGQPGQLIINERSDLKFSVFGEVDSSYTLTYSTENPPTELINGRRVGLFVVPYGKYGYFTFKAKQEELNNTDIMFFISTSVGSVELYVNTKNTFPSPRDYNWSTRSPNALLIPGISKLITSNEFRVTVEGTYSELSALSYYSIMALQSNKSILLSNDQIVSSKIVNTDFYQFYQYPLDGSMKLLISIESVGVINLYYSTENPKPIGQDGAPQEINGIYNQEILFSGSYLYIAVKTSSSTPVSYKLKVKIIYRVLPLNRISGEDSVANNEIHQFRFDLKKNIASHLSFALVNITGSTIMYVSNDCQPANETHYNWKVDPETQYGQVLMLSNQQVGCYCIGVYGLVASTFKLSAFLDDAFIRLRDTILMKASTDRMPNILNYYGRPYSDYLVLNIKAVSGYVNVGVAKQIYSPDYSSYSSNGDHDRSLIIPITEFSSSYVELSIAISGKAGEPNPMLQLTLDNTICYGKIPSANNVCSGKGNCIGYNECECLEGYEGDECELFKCFDILMSNKTVCSSRGNCVSPNKCECSGGYFGDSCELFNCFGIAFSDERVCSGNGFCSSLDKCQCKYGYFGAECDQNVLCPESEKDSFYCSNIESKSNETETNIVEVQNINNHLTITFEKYENIIMVLPSTISEYVFLNNTLGQTILTMASSVIPESSKSQENSKVVSPIVNFILLQNGTTERIEITNLKEPIHLYMHNISVQKEAATSLSCAFYDSNSWNTDNVTTTILNQIEQGEATIFSVSCSSKSWTSSVAIISQMIAPNPPPTHESSQQGLPKDSNSVIIGENHNYYYLIGLGLILLIVVIVILVVGVVAFVIYRRKKKASSSGSGDEKKENYNNINYANLKEEEA